MNENICGEAPIFEMSEGNNQMCLIISERIKIYVLTIYLK